MDAKTMGELISLIEAKYEMTSRKFTPGVEELYRVGMEPMESGTARRVVTELLLTTTWPPSIDVILAAAARHESPTPSEDDAWSEVYAKCGLVRPSPWSHPLIEHACRDLGGVNAIWHELQYANGGQGTPSSIVGAQFRKCYQHRRQEWESEVTAQLRLPADQRNACLFPVPAGTRFHQFAPPSDRQLRSIEAQQSERIQTPAISLEEIKSKVAEMRAALKQQTPESIGRTMTDARKHRSRAVVASALQQAHEGDANA